MTTIASCKCWIMSPPIPHEGHCCFRGDPEDYRLHQPAPCGHYEEV